MKEITEKNITRIAEKLSKKLSTFTNDELLEMNRRYYRNEKLEFTPNEMKKLITFLELGHITFDEFYDACENLDFGIAHDIWLHFEGAHEVFLRSIYGDDFDEEWLYEMFYPQYKYANLKLIYDLFEIEKLFF